MTKFDQKKAEIKQAGIKAFAAYGFYKTTLDDIAGMLGMKKNSLYYYFENKEVLIREILLDEAKSHLELVEAEPKADIPADEKLLRFTETIINFIRQRATEYTVTIQAIIELSRVIHKMVPEFQNQQIAAFKTILNQGIARKDFRPHDSEQLAEDLADLIPAIFNHHYVTSDLKFVSEIDFDKISAEIKRFIIYVINGIKAETL